MACASFPDESGSDAFLNRMGIRFRRHGRPSFYSPCSRRCSRSPQQPSQHPTLGVGKPLVAVQPLASPRSLSCPDAPFGGSTRGSCRSTSAQAAGEMAGDAPRRFPASCFGEPPRSAHRLSTAALQRGVALGKDVFRRRFIACRRVRLAAFSAVRVAFAVAPVCFRPVDRFRLRSTRVAEDLLHRAGTLHSRPFDRLLHRISTLHTSSSCTSLQRVSVRSTRPLVGCFDERSLGCGTCPGRRRPGTRPVVSPHRASARPFSVGQASGRAGCCTRPSVPFRPSSGRSSPQANLP